MEVEGAAPAGLIAAMLSLSDWSTCGLVRMVKNTKETLRAGYDTANALFSNVNLNNLDTSQQAKDWSSANRFETRLSRQPSSHVRADRSR